MEIREKAIAVGIAFADAETIDRVNIYQATINSMYEEIVANDGEDAQISRLDAEAFCVLGSDRFGNTHPVNTAC